MEEFDTGLVRRATRTQVGDVTFLTTSDGAGDVWPEGYDVGDVYLGPGGDLGGHLADAGLDVGPVRHQMSASAPLAPTLLEPEREIVPPDDPL